MVAKSSAWTACVALAAALLCACKQDDSDPSNTGLKTTQPSNPSPPPSGGTCNDDAPGFHAFLAEGPCADVAGANGIWKAQRLFPDAPADIRDTACTYRWSGATREAKADVDALSSLGAKLLTKSIDKPRPCSEVLVPQSISLTALPPPSGDSAPTGVVGCDVCGRVSGDQVYVILPAENLALRTLVVDTSVGQQLSFVRSAADSAQVFSAKLPALSQGATYTAGWIPLLKDPF